MTRALLQDLTKGRSLFDVWRLTWHMRSVRFVVHRIVTIASAVIAGAIAYFSDLSLVELGALVRETSSTLALGYAAAIFGIVVAGFAIFGTIGTSELVEPLTLIGGRDVGGQKVSELKFISLHFVKAFVSFLLFFMFAFAIMFFGMYRGPATMIANAHPELGRIGASAAMGLLAGFVTHLLIALNMLVFNIYMSLMTMARARIDPTLKVVLKDAKEKLETECADATAIPKPPPAAPTPVRVPGAKQELRAPDGRSDPFEEDSETSDAIIHAKKKGN